jgi:hypothetical protein
MTTEYVMTDIEVDAAVLTITQLAGVTLDELHAMHERGRFDTEAQRRAWFVVSGLGR